METEVNHKLPFLDVLLDNSNPAQSLFTSVFRKSTYTGVLTNFLSFSFFPYKLGLIRKLVDMTFEITTPGLDSTTTLRSSLIFREESVSIPSCEQHCETIP